MKIAIRKIIVECRACSGGACTHLTDQDVEAILPDIENALDDMVSWLKVRAENISPLLSIRKED